MKNKTRLFAVIIIFQIISANIINSQENVDSNGHIKITSGGKIAISSDKTQPPSISAEASAEYDLFAKNGILTKDYGIYPNSFWPDYVFRDNYELMDLKELENFIERYKHLPNMPSEENIAMKGYKIHEMNVAFLEKIEELTLYILLQEKRLSKLEHQLTSLKKTILK